MAQEVKDAIPEGWSVDEEEDIPKGWVVDEPEEQYRDEVTKEIEAAGLDPDVGEEFERTAERGIAEATRGIASGLTFGVTENIPGLKTGENIASTTGKVIGSLLPISKMMKVAELGAVKLASKSPVFQRQLGSVLKLMGVGAAGAGYEAAEDLAQGHVPTADDVLDNGATWMALDLGLNALGAAGRFTKSLINKAKKTGQPSFTVINDTLNEMRAQGVDFKNPEISGAKALSILEQEAPQSDESFNRFIQNTQKLQPQPQGTLARQQELKEGFGVRALKNQEKITPKQLKGRKISEDPVNRLTNESRILAEPYQPKKIDLRKESQALEESAIDSQLESVGPRAVSEQELGTSIKEDVEKKLKQDKKGYREMYDLTKQPAKEMSHIPENAARVTLEKLEKIGKGNVKPKGYEATIEHLENVMKDIGYEKTLAGKFVKTRPVPVEDTIELGIRLNEIADFEAIEPSVKDAIKDVVKAVKQDIRIGLKSNPDARAAFELAEEEYGRIARKYEKDTVRKIRQMQEGERVATMLNKPTVIEDLREVLSPAQMKQVEREILEKLDTMPYEKAQKQLREINRHLSENNRQLAKDIVEAKNPHNPATRTKLLQESVLNDVSNAFSIGTRPEKTLNLWKTPKGQKIVNETFANRPNKALVTQYLEKQSFNDLVSGVLKKDGTLDLAKFNEFMQDPGAVNNIRMLGGEEAVSFFKTLDAQSKQLAQNVKLLDRFPEQIDIKKGKELLERQERVAEVERRKRGKEILKKIPERAEELPIRAEAPKEAQLAKKTLQIKEKPDLEAIEARRQRGASLLKRMAEKDFSARAKSQKFTDWFIKEMGFSPKAALTVFSAMKLGIPNAVGVLFSYRIMNRLMTSTRLRKAFQEAAKHHSNPVRFIAAMEHLGQVFDEEEPETRK